MAVKPIPDGYHSLTPYLTVQGAAPFIDFVKKAYGAEDTFRMPGPGGVIMHAEVKIGDSVLMVTDAAREAAMPGAVYLYVQDVDAAYTRAIEAGATSLAAPADMFWGDRFARVKDAFGNVWSIATHTEDVPPEEMSKRARAAMQQAGG
jgi:PhnB protein